MSGDCEGIAGLGGDFGELDGGVSLLPMIFLKSARRSTFCVPPGGCKGFGGCAYGTERV